MAHLQLTTSLLGLGLAGLILYLLRRDHLHLSHGLFWILIAAVAALFGIWPGLIDHLARFVGIAYPPTLLLLLALLVALVKALHADLLNTRLELQLKRINQQVALLAEKFQASSPGTSPTQAVPGPGGAQQAHHEPTSMLQSDRGPGD